jgi:hypothetical protein
MLQPLPMSLSGLAPDGELVLTGGLLMALLVWCLQVQSGWLQVLLALPALILAAVLFAGRSGATGRKDVCSGMASIGC